MLNVGCIIPNVDRGRSDDYVVDVDVELAMYCQTWQVDS